MKTDWESIGKRLVALRNEIGGHHAVIAQIGVPGWVHDELNKLRVDVEYLHDRVVGHVDPEPPEEAA